MSAFSVPAKVFFWAFLASAAAVLFYALSTIRSPLNTDVLLLFALLTVATTIADVFIIEFRSNLSLTIATSINFAAVLLLGPLAVLVGAAGSVISDIYFRKAWFKLLFNASNVALSAFAAAVLYGLVKEGETLYLGSLNNALAAGLAGAAYLLVNTAAYSTMIGLVEGHSPIDLAKSYYRGVAFQFITLIPLGTLITVLYYREPFAIVLLLLPIVLARQSFMSYHKLLTESKETIELLADAVDTRDRYTFQHSLRVSKYVDKVARRMDMSLDDLEVTLFAARVHDLGKIGIPSSVLFKESTLTDDERRIMEQHSTIGALILSRLSTYGRVRDLIVHHHERVDGKGYPAGLTGERIPLGAKILAVADAFEAMTSDRPYRKALSKRDAIAELQRCRGTQFDPLVVDHFVAALVDGEKEPDPITLEPAQMR